MTDEQKKAISIITYLRCKNTISEEEFFLLLDFIIQEKIVYQPPYNPITPITPIYESQPYRVTCEFDNQATSKETKS